MYQVASRNLHLEVKDFSPRLYHNKIAAMQSTGPKSQEDYSTLKNFYSLVNRQRKSGKISSEQLAEFRSWFGDSMLTTKALQGHAASKPHGYDGDFEIIDKFYLRHESKDEPYTNWDRFLQEGDAPQAVRNRKDYLISLLNTLPKGARVLNLASGPCRDILEFTQQSDKYLRIHNVDLDPVALVYGQGVLATQKSLSLSFEKKNVLRFQSSVDYDLIWSAGLFDYFNDKVFVHLLKRLSGFLKKDGRLVIGNFNTNVQSQDYMEFADWFLNYRDEAILLRLSQDIPAVFDRRVEREPLGVNLFLNLQF